MAKLEAKLKNLQKMIVALQQAVNRLENSTPDDIDFIQDSVVSRFKILIESAWKDLSLFLIEQGFADVPGSPKGVIHFAFEAKIISQQEYDEFLKYLNLRNVASHLYDKPQYLLVVDAAPQACIFVKKLYDRMNTQQLLAV